MLPKNNPLTMGITTLISANSHANHTIIWIFPRVCDAFPRFFGSFHDLFLSPLGISHVGTSGRWFSIAFISPDCGRHQTLGFLCSGEYLPPGSLTARLPLKSDRAPILKGSSSNHHFSRAKMLNFRGVRRWWVLNMFFFNVQAWILGDDDPNWP